MQFFINEIVKKICDNSLDDIDVTQLLKIANEEAELDVLFKIALYCISKNKSNYAISIFEFLLEKNCNDLRIPYNLGLLHSNNEQHSNALHAFNVALKIDPKNPEALVLKGFSLFALKQYDEALETLTRATKADPTIPEIYFGLGNTLFELKRFEEAIIQYEKALDINPNYAEALSNKGNTLFELKRFEEAITQYEKALGINPNYAEALSNKGAALKELHRYTEAIFQYEKALTINPKLPNALEYLFHLKMKICHWNNFNQNLNQLILLARQDKKVVHPFIMLSLVDDPKFHQLIASNYCSIKYPENPALKMPIYRPAQKKIRIGYFSADFRTHPVAQLSVNLFELHDRSQFEVFGFSLRNTKSNDEMSSHLSKVFDTFINIENLSDLNAATLARNLNIDIAIDLGGHTQYSRTGIFALRAAPIQINYLGYPGSTGANYIDYIMADQTLIPPGTEQYYSEKIILLPISYQINSRKNLPRSSSLQKSDFNLPENAFVFCCFNNSYKILPETFSRWMQILNQTSGSVLWLLEDNPVATANLKKEAKARGISPDRLIFAKHLPLNDHIARLALGDVFLDTYPYGAHTTASDALWAGLPVITLTGSSFASRVSASLLNALELPELITESSEEYIDLAIKMANNSEIYSRIKLKLESNSVNSYLFNSQITTSNIENAYKAIFDRYIRKLAPEHFYNL